MELRRFFFDFRFFTGSYRGLNFWEKLSEFRSFYSHFPEFLPKFSSIMLKYVKFVNNNTVDYIFRDKNVLLTILI